MSWRTLAEVGGFQLVWLVCALSAAHGHGALGLLAAGLYIVGQFAVNRWSHATCLTVLAGGIFAVFAESLLAASGLVRYAAAWPSESLAPAWMVGLWLAFATTLETTRRLMGVRPILKSAVLGTLLGPLAYLAGARLGALSLPETNTPSLLAIAAIWGLAFPALMAMQPRITASGGHPRL
jgi:hypothetical protein